jgi:ubiquinone/menaquinone biosynthesis C-methylase UbiE
MVAQARARNAAAVEDCRVDLREGYAENLPFEAESYDAALAMNSMQVWMDRVAGLREVRRVLRPGGRIALGFTPYSGQSKEGLAEMLTAVGFTGVRLVETDGGFCALATKP